MNKERVILSNALFQTAEALINLEAANPLSQKSVLKPLPPTDLVDPNSSLANPEHAKARGAFALEIIEEYSQVPGIDAQEFETAAKNLLSSLEDHDSFTGAFANASGVFSRQETVFTGTIKPISYLSFWGLQLQWQL